MKEIGAPKNRILCDRVEGMRRRDKNRRIWSNTERGGRLRVAGKSSIGPLESAEVYAVDAPSGRKGYYYWITVALARFTT